MQLALLQWILGALSCQSVINVRVFNHQVNNQSDGFTHCNSQNKVSL